MLHDTWDNTTVTYHIDRDPPGDTIAIGASTRAGLASFLAFADRLGVRLIVAAHVRPPIQECATGFTHLQKGQALVTALAAGLGCTLVSAWVGAAV